MAAVGEGVMVTLYRRIQFKTLKKEFAEVGIDLFTSSQPAFTVALWIPPFIPLVNAIQTRLIPGDLRHILCIHSSE